MGISGVTLPSDILVRIRNLRPGSQLRFRKVVGRWRWWRRWEEVGG